MTKEDLKEMAEKYRIAYLFDEDDGYYVGDQLTNLINEVIFNSFSTWDKQDKLTNNGDNIPERWK